MYHDREQSSDVPPGTPVEEAIPLLYDRHAPMIRGLVWRMSGDAEAIDDLVQDTFLEAHRSWGGFEGRSKASTWLGGIAFRQWRRRGRRRSGEPETIPSLEELLPFGDSTSSVIPGDQETPLEHSIRLEAAEAVHQAILALPDDFRLPLVMKEMLELPVVDVADALGLKPETVKTRLHRARLRIREAMRKSLPQSPAVPPDYDRQTCIDLMNAKLGAQDAGRRFPVDNEILCERCLTIFRELDLAVDLSRTFDSQEPSTAEREELLHAIFSGSADATEASSDD